MNKSSLKIPLEIKGNTNSGLVLLLATFILLAVGVALLPIDIQTSIFPTNFIGWFVIISSLLFLAFCFKFIYSLRLRIDEKGLYAYNIFIPWQEIVRCIPCTHMLGPMHPMTFKMLVFEVRNTDKIMQRLNVFNQAVQRRLHQSYISKLAKESSITMPQNFYVNLTHCSIDPNDISLLVNCNFSEKLGSNN